MQSTNSEYGSPYLAVCHVTFTFVLSVSLSVYLSLCLSTFKFHCVKPLLDQSFFLSFFLSFFFFLSPCLSVSVCLSVCLSPFTTSLFAVWRYLSYVCLSVCLCLQYLQTSLLSFNQSVCLSISQSFVCLSLCKLFIRYFSVLLLTFSLLPSLFVWR